MFHLQNPIFHSTFISNEHVGFMIINEIYADSDFDFGINDLH